VSERTGYLSAPAGQPAIRVLVVDDEPDIADLVALAVRMEGAEAVTAGDAREGLRLLRSFRPDIAVLDVMLPDQDGLALLGRMRAEQPQLPALMLTARGELEHRLAGLSAGADDYLAKPFSVEELLARMCAVLRRSGRGGLSADALVVSDLELDEAAREVRRGGEVVDLTPTEFDLLLYLMINARTVLSKESILQRVWHGAAERANLVEVYIGYLRRKIDDGHEPLLHTVRGVGYVLRPPHDSP